MKKAKRVGSDPLEGLSWITSTEQKGREVGLPLSDIRFVAPQELKPNPINSFFNSETSEYFETLRNDIRERGIIVPLLAKEDGTILAGHNRLLVAQELGLASVPVQYILQSLTEEEERAFIFKDNIIRRQLTALEKQKLIERLYQDEISRDNRGGDRRSDDAKIKSSTELLISLPEIIEKETGIPAGTAKRILATLRKSKSASNEEITSEQSEDKRRSILLQFVRKNIASAEKPLEIIAILKKELARIEKKISTTA
jgi:ParB-like chromosome segregation protein Spo0J